LKRQPVIQSVQNDLDLNLKKDHIDLYIPLRISKKHGAQLSSLQQVLWASFPVIKWKGC